MDYLNSYLFLAVAMMATSASLTGCYAMAICNAMMVQTKILKGVGSAPSQMGGPVDQRKRG